MNFGTKVACSFLNLAIKQNNKSNIVVSPLNFDGVLRTIAHGYYGGKKGKLMDYIFGLHGSDPFPEVFNDSNLRVNNHVFMDESLPITSWYPQMMQKKYKATIHRVDFQNMAKLNVIQQRIKDVASEDTSGLIEEVITQKQMRIEFRVIALNSLYYQSKWIHPFKSDPEQIDFHTIEGKIVRPKFMSSCNFSHSRFDGFDLIRIPYMDDASMYIILPDTVHELNEKILDDRSNDFLYQDYKLETSQPFDSLWLPKLHLKCKTTSLVDIADKICEAVLANVSHLSISDTGILKTWRVAHECSIKVDEKGTEAAASTLKILETCGFPMKDIVVDKPFLFMIRHDVSKLIYFLGMVMDPMQL